MLVIASTPVLGPELLERMLIPFIAQAFDAYRSFAGEDSDTDRQPGAGEHGSSMSLALARSPGAMFIDTETWPSNERAQHELLNALSAYERVVILGGDVHYGTNLSIDWYTFDRSVGASSRRKARMVQLTSSAARNAFETRVEAIYRGYHWLNQWMFGPGFEGIAWKESHRIRLPAGAGVSLLRHARMKEKPALLPAWGWPEGTSIAAGDDPDWAWRLTMLRDERPDDARKGPFEDAADQIENDIRDTEPRTGVERARGVAAIHQKAHSLDFAPLREVVFTNNVGVITFEPGSGGARSVVHTLYSTDEKGYPEDEFDEDLVTDRPLGAGAEVSAGGAKTVIRASLIPAGDAPVPFTGVRPDA